VQQQSDDCDVTEFPLKFDPEWGFDGDAGRLGAGIQPRESASSWLEALEALQQHECSCSSSRRRGAAGRRPYSNNALALLCFDVLCGSLSVLGSFLRGACV
jgi:hypothetical protein